MQNFLKQKLESRFVKNIDWLLKSPDCNPLDYYFWDRVQEKVYNGHYCYPFATIDELKRRIRDVWDECATDLPQIRKAMKLFLPRSEAVDEKERGLIKTVFGLTLTNKYIYRTLCDYLVSIKSLHHNFLVIWRSLTKKENLKSFFDVKIFTFRGYSYQPYATLLVHIT